MRNAVLLILCCSALAAPTITQPKFFARRDYPSGGVYVSVADVNGDGKPDIIGVGGFPTVSVLLGNGNGTFRAPTNSDVQWEVINGGVPVDLNGDGKVDLVIGGGPAGLRPGAGIGVCFGNGDGTFQAPILYSAGTDVTVGNPVVGDFNGDGIPDVVASGSSGIWLFAGKGGGVFSSGMLVLAISGDAYSPPVRAVATADFNGDGNLDLALTYSPTGKSNGILVSFGNGNGTFQTPVFYGGSSPIFISVADVNGDGHPDIVVPGATIYWNDGHGGFPIHTQISITGNQVAVGDVNGDHIPDLVSSYGDVALGLGDHKFAPPINYPVANTNGWFSVVVKDLRNNGVNDIVTGLNQSVSVLLNQGNGTFIDGKWTSVPGAGNCGAAADFNGDGKPDLAVPTTQGITVLLGTGNASAPYATGPSFAVSGVGCPITGDLNGDGIPDLLVGASGLGGVGAYLGNGDGTFRLASVIPVGPTINMVLGDFNHDGKPDFADSSNELALGNGDGTFQSPVTINPAPPYPGYSWIAAGDLNNDGWTDIVGVEWSVDGGVKGALYVLLNDQEGGFTLTTITDSGGPIAIMLRDLNRDGNLDAIATEDGNATASVYLGNGKGGLKLIQQNIPFPFVDELPAQIGDVNGDGIPDLVLPADGSIGIALGKGDGTFLAPFAVGAGGGLGQVLFENLHGRSPKADLPDLVAPDSNGGVTVLINITK